MPPYQSLGKLVREVGPDAENMKPKARDRLLEWCSKHGLLGILPHRTLSIVLAPRFEHRINVGTIIEELPKRFTCDAATLMVQNEYLRQPSGWESRVHHVRYGKGGVEGEPVPEPAASKLFDKPRALIYDEFMGRRNLESLDTTWARFFPKVPPQEWQSYAYPLPATNEFWNLYAEPVSRFLHMAILLQLTLGAIGKGHPEAHETFRAFLEPIGPAVIPTTRDVTLEQRWNSGSLLATFAMMAYLDVTSGGRVIQCARDRCRVFFVTTAWQAAYCSDRCRWAVQRKRNRDKQEQARHHVLRHHH
jgi:hypothetical protein